LLSPARNMVNYAGGYRDGSIPGIKLLAREEGEKKNAELTGKHVKREKKGNVVGGEHYEEGR